MQDEDKESKKHNTENLKDAQLRSHQNQGEPRCSRNVSCSCFLCDTRRVPDIYSPVVMSPNLLHYSPVQTFSRGCRDRDRMVDGITTAYAISVYHYWCCEFESRSGRGVQHYVIKFVIDLRQVGGFLQVLRCPPPIKLTTTI